MRIANPLYQTLFTVIFAYVLMFLPRALIGLRASIAQAPVELEDTARSLGRTPSQAIWGITMRLAAPGAAAGAALVFLAITNELTATLLLAPSGTRDVSLSNAGEGIGDPATLRHLTISGKAGEVVVPPGTYGKFTASGHTTLVLGVEGATVPAALRPVLAQEPSARGETDAKELATYFRQSTPLLAVPPRSPMVTSVQSVPAIGAWATGARAGAKRTVTPSPLRVSSPAA